MAIDVEAVAREVEADGRVVDTLQRVLGSPREDAEDALQEAFIRMMKRADRIAPDGNIRGYLFRVALNVARSDAARRSRRIDFAALSLDAFDEGGDFLHGGIDEDAGVAARLEIDRLMHSPVGRELVASALAGGDIGIRQRGSGHSKSLYTDEQIREVRWHHDAGVLPLEISRLTGVKRAYVEQIVSFSERVGVASAGWTADLVLTAIKEFHAEHGRPPRLKDSKANPLLPSQMTASRFFGTWNGSIEAAGLEGAAAHAWKARAGRWNVDTIAEALLAFERNNRRRPQRRDLERMRGRRAELYPSYATVCRHYPTLTDALNAARTRSDRSEVAIDQLDGGGRAALDALSSGQRVDFTGDALAALGAVFGVARGSTQPWEASTWDADSVVAALRQFHHVVGRAPRGRDLEEGTSEIRLPTIHHVREYFDGLADALRAAGLKPAKRRKPMPFLGFVQALEIDGEGDRQCLA